MPVAVKKSRFQLHVEKWSSCERCELSTQRSRVVHVRGKIPCDVLMVGEAPGDSEDVLGSPFVGPAGQLLDYIVNEGKEHFPACRFAFCNLVGCFPKEGKKTGDHAPPDAAIKACSPRVGEIVAVTQPQLVVCVGQLSSKWTRKYRADWDLGDTPLLDLVHPAAILREPPASKPLSIRQAVIRLRDAVDKLTPF